MLKFYKGVRIPNSIIAYGPPDPFLWRSVFYLTPAVCLVRLVLIMSLDSHLFCMLNHLMWHCHADMTYLQCIPLKQDNLLCQIIQFHTSCFLVHHLVTRWPHSSTVHQQVSHQCVWSDPSVTPISAYCLNWVFIPGKIFLPLGDSLYTTSSLWSDLLSNADA